MKLEMPTLSSLETSEEAKRLIEGLALPIRNEERWYIAERYLTAAFEAGAALARSMLALSVSVSASRRMKLEADRCSCDKKHACEGHRA